MFIIKEFKCGISGDECVIVLNEFNEEICILKKDFK